MAAPAVQRPFCLGCGARIRGLTLEREGEGIFVEASSQAMARIVAVNAGQLTLTPKSLTLAAGTGTAGVELAWDAVEPLVARARREIVVRMPAGLPAGRHVIVLETHEGPSAKLVVRLVPLPTMHIDAGDRDGQGRPVVYLEPLEGGGEESGQERWAGTMEVLVEVPGDETVTLAAIEGVMLERHFPALMRPRALRGAERIPLRLEVDAQTARVAADAGEAGVEGRVVLRVEGHPADIVRSFWVRRRQVAALGVSYEGLNQALAGQPGSDGLTIVHGLGRRLSGGVEVFNQGDLEVEIGGAVHADHPAVGVRGAAGLVGKRVPRRGAAGLEVRLDIDVDAIDLEALPSFEDSAAKRLGIVLVIPLRQPAGEDRLGDSWSVRLHVRDLVVRPATLAVAEHLCVDLGTTNTCVAWAHEGRAEVRLLDVDPLDGLGEVHPSLVYFHDFEAAEYRFGAVQREAMYVDLQTFLGTATEFKPELGREAAGSFYIDARGQVQRRTPREAAAVYLRHVFGELKRLHLGDVPAQVHLSYPISFDESERAVLEGLVGEAVAWEGVTVLALASEPAALLGALLYDPEGMPVAVGESRVFAVFDFGGGTTDILITRVERPAEDDEVYSHLAQDVVERGGEELTRRLARAIWPRVRRALAGSERVRGERALLELLRRFIVPESARALGALSDAEKDVYRSLLRTAELVKVHYEALREGGGAVPSVAYTLKAREKTAILNLALADVFELEVVDEVVDAFVGPMLDVIVALEARLKASEGVHFAIDTVCLAGNSSRLVRVQELAAARFGPERVRFAGHKLAKEGVALGLAHRVVQGLLADEEVGESTEVGYALVVKGKVYPAGELCCRKFMRGQRLMAHELDPFGKPGKSPVAVFAMASAMTGRPIERLCVKLVAEGEALAVEVYEEDGGEPGALRATLRSE